MRLRSWARQVWARYSIGPRPARAVAAIVVAGGLLAAIWYGAPLVRSPTRTAREISRSAVNGSEASDAGIIGRLSIEPTLESEAATSSGLASTAQLTLARLEDAARTQASAEAHATLGRARLVAGDLDAGVASLERAVRASGSPARAHADLAAAYLTRAIKTHRVEDSARALAAAERAVRLAPTSPAAAYNRALALQHLGLVDAARAAWRGCLTVERHPAWRARIEATLRQAPFASPARHADAVLAELKPLLGQGRVVEVTRLCKAYPFVTRRYLEEDLLGAWADGYLEQRHSAGAQALVEAATLAAGLEAGVGHTLARQVVIGLVAATEVGGARARVLAEGHHDYVTARRLDGRGEQANAARHYGRALRAFEAGRSPMAGWARFWTGVLQFRDRASDASVTTLERTIREADGAGVLIGRARYVQGLAHQSRGRYEAALAALVEALGHLEASREIELAAEARVALSEVFDAIGQPDRAWQLRLRSLREQASMQNPRDRHLVLLDTVKATLRQQLPEASLGFADEAVANARGWGHPGAFVEIEAARADAWTRVGSTDAARAAIARAREHMASIPDRRFAERWEPLTGAIEARALLRDDPAGGLRAARQALAMLDRVNARGEQPELYRIAASALVALRRPEEADASLTRGMGIVEAERRALSDAELRVASFDAAYELYLDRAELSAALGRWDVAFDTLERARSASFGRAAAETAQLADVRAHLPADTAVVYFALLRTRAVAWVVTARGWRVVDLGAPDPLRRVVRQLRDAIAVERRSAIDAASVAAYRAVIAPLADAIGGAARLVLVPDDLLGLLPFPLLMNPASGRRLVQDFTLSAAPNVTWLRSEEIRRLRPSSWSDGAPLFVAASDGRAGLLTAARREVTESAKAYRQSDILLDAEATPLAVLGRLQDTPLLHIASHAIASSDFPWLSRLSLHADTEGRGELFMYQIAGLRMRPGALVVLSACDTASGSVSRAAGVIGLAWGFLAAGADTVVGTLWQIEDRAAAALMTDFHRRLAASGNPIAALREAQLQQLASTTSLDWAAFQAIGGVGRGSRRGD